MHTKRGSRAYGTDGAIEATVSENELAAFSFFEKQATLDVAPTTL